MKKINILFLQFLFWTSFAFGQIGLEHKVKLSKHKHVSTIDHPSLNNKANMFVFVTPKSDTYVNPNEIGVYYRKGKWVIFNENKKPLPRNAKFNVLALPANSKNVFKHTVTSTNTTNNRTMLNHKATNKQKDAVLIVTQRYGKYNTSPVGVQYSKGKWQIVNLNSKPIPVGTEFNVLVLKKGKGNKIKGYQSNAFQHLVQIDPWMMRFGKNISYLKEKALKNNSSALLLTTPVVTGVINPHVTGVYYKAPYWAIANQNKKRLVNKTKFNVVALNQNTLLYTGYLNPNLPQLEWTIPQAPQFVLDSLVQPKPIIDYSKLIRVNQNLVLPASSVINNNDFRRTWRLNPYQPIKKPEEEQPEAVQNTESLGPNMDDFRTITAVSDAEFVPLLNNLNIHPHLMVDKNPHSNILYFLPAEYSLFWEATAQAFSLNLNYLPLTTSENGEVNVSARLKPDLREEDIELAELIISKKMGRPMRLIPLPMANNPRLSFGNSLANFNVEESTISTSMPSDVLEPITVDWRMGDGVEAFLQTLMNNADLSASIEFFPWGATDKKKSVNASFKIRSPKTYGKIEFFDAASFLNGFINPTHYPISLDRLVILRENEETGALTVERVPLNNQQVGSNAVSSPVSTTTRNLILDGDKGLINKMWLEYTLLPCEECNTIVHRKITGGASGATRAFIKFDVLPNVLAVANSPLITIQVKSRQANPNGETEGFLDLIRIREADMTYEASNPLFVYDDRNIDFQYRITVITENEEQIVSDWIEGAALDVIISSNVVQELLDAFQILKEIEE